MYFGNFLCLILAFAFLLFTKNLYRRRSHKVREYGLILHKLAAKRGAFQTFTQFLDAKDLCELMKANKEFREIIATAPRDHMNKDFVTDFKKYFVTEMPNGLKIFEYFNMFCIYFRETKVGKTF